MLTQKQIAKKLGVSGATVSRWVAAKKIPYYRLNGLVRFDESVIDSWVEKRRVRTKQQS
jgi:excisionase family DNA binding protein